MQVSSSLLLAAGLIVSLAISPVAAVAGGELAGMGSIRAKNTRTNVVFLDRGEFSITKETVVRGMDGKRIRIAEIDVPDLARGMTQPPLGLIEVKYAADSVGDELILRSLDLLPLMD